MGYAKSTAAGRRSRDPCGMADGGDAAGNDAETSIGRVVAQNVWAVVLLSHLALPPANGEVLLTDGIGLVNLGLGHVRPQRL